MSSRTWRSSGLAGTRTRGRLTAYLGDLIVAKVPLVIAVDVDARRDAHPTATVSARRFRLILASHSRKDRDLVAWFGAYARDFADVFLRRSRARIRRNLWPMPLGRFRTGAEIGWWSRSAAQVIWAAAQ